MVSIHTRSNLRIFGGSSHPELTKKVAKKVGVRMGSTKLAKFANNETNVQILENVRGQDVYVLQTGGGQAPNDNLMEILFLINAFKLSAAGNITVITPYFPYSKSDQKDGNRVPIASKLVADMIKKAGAAHIMMLDPHTPQLEGFFDMPCDAVLVEPLFCEWIKHNIPDWEDCVVVSPDEGGVKRSVSVANDLSLDFALIHNRNKPRMEKKNKKMSSSASHSRLQPDQDENGGGGAVAGASSSNGASAGGSLSEAARIRRISRASSVRSSDHKRSACLSGDVEGRTVIVIDDMIDTGKTLKFAAEMLEIEGASRMYFFASHGVFSRGCMAKIREIGSDFLKAVVVTNSMPQERHTGEIPGFHVIDVSGLIAEYIRRHHYRESVSVLSQFMPIRDELPVYKSNPVPRANNNNAGNDGGGVGGGSNPPIAELDQLNLDPGQPSEGGATGGGGEPSKDGATEDASGEEEEDDEDAIQEGVPENRKMLKLRKGFRLSSMCWDND